jgi:hypothetical protein
VYALTVTDPTYRGRVLSKHSHLSPATMLQLRAIYGAHGYSPHCLFTES